MRALFLAAVVALAVLGWAWRPWAAPQGGPRAGHVEHPEMVDVGEVQAGEFAAVRFALTNRHTEPFTIVRFNPGCGCISLSKESGGGEVALTNESRETLAPGESFAVKAQVSAQADAAGRIAQTIRFHTDLPGCPEIAVRVTGLVRYGIQATPNEISFGEVVPGRPALARVRIADARRPGQRTPIEASTDSAYVRVMGIRRADPEPDAPSCPDCDHYELSLELLVPPGGSEQHIRGAVKVTGGLPKPFTRILFAASVRQGVRLSPSSLVLRREKDGPHRARSVLTCDAPAEVRLVSAPAGLLVRIESSPDGRTHEVTAEADPARIPPKGLVTAVLEVGPGGPRHELKVFVPAS